MYPKDKLLILPKLLFSIVPALVAFQNSEPSSYPGIGIIPEVPGRNRKIGVIKK